MGMFMVTAGLNPRLQSDRDTADAVGELVRHIGEAGDMRRPPKPWRATYPLDDPDNFPPDLWVATLDAGNVWCKTDGGHDPQPRADGSCDWCGQTHADPLPIYTFMDPSDY